MARLLVHKGYIRAINSNPSDRLIKKLRKLGWKTGQLIYTDWVNHELRFFNTNEELMDFLESKKTLYDRPIKPESNWDTLADIELQFEELDRVQ